jgi:hypothetical protein
VTTALAAQMPTRLPLDSVDAAKPPVARAQLGELRRLLDLGR